MPPYAPAQYQAPPQPVPAAPRKRVSYNPFRHLANGMTAVFKHNLGTSFVIALISAAGSIVISIIVTIVGAAAVNTSLFASPAAVIPKFLVVMVIGYILTGVVASFFQLSLFRSTLLTIRKTPVTVGQVLSFAKSRFVFTLKTLLAIFGVYAAVYGAMAIMSIITLYSSLRGGGAGGTLFTLLLNIAGIIFLIIFSFRMMYVYFVLADDQKPPSVKSAMGRSNKLWKKSGTALFLYLLMVGFVLLVLFFSLGGDPSPRRNSTYDSSLNGNSALDAPGAGASAGIVVGALGITVIVAAIANLIGFIVLAGMADVYVEACEVLGVGPPRQQPGGAPPQQPGGQVSQPPYNPYQQPPAGPPVPMGGYEPYQRTAPQEFQAPASEPQSYAAQTPVTNPMPPQYQQPGQYQQPVQQYPSDQPQYSGQQPPRYPQ